MDSGIKLAEVSAGQGIPVAVAVGAALVLGQELQLPDVVRICRHQVPIVIYRGGNEAIICRILSGTKAPVQKQPLYPGVAHAPGIAGEVNPLGYGVRAPNAGRQAPEFLLSKIGRLVQKQPIIALPLVFAFHRGPIAGQVAKLDRGAVAKGEHPGGAVVRSGLRRKQAKHGENEGVFHLVKFPADQENLNAGILKRAPGRLVHHGPALSAASGPAVTGVFRPTEKKGPLGLRVGSAQVNGYGAFFHVSPPFTFICSISKSKKSPFPHFKGPLPSAPPPKRSVPASSSGPVWDIRTRSLETLTGHET